MTHEEIEKRKSLIKSVQNIPEKMSPEAERIIETIAKLELSKAPMMDIAIEQAKLNRIMKKLGYGKFAFKREAIST